MDVPSLSFGLEDVVASTRREASERLFGSGGRVPWRETSSSFKDYEDSLGVSSATELCTANITHPAEAVNTPCTSHHTHRFLVSTGFSLLTSPFLTAAPNPSSAAPRPGTQAIKPRPLLECLDDVHPPAHASFMDATHTSVLSLCVDDPLGGLMRPRSLAARLGARPRTSPRHVKRRQRASTCTKLLA